MFKIAGTEENRPVKIRQMFLKYIEKATQGIKSWNKKILNVPVYSSLLENLRCHNTDEYPVLSPEDESPIPPLACSFSKNKNTGHVLALVDESGNVVLYNTNLAGEQAFIADWEAHNNAVFDLEWMKGEQKLLTASGDQSVCLWDVPCKKKLLTFKGHCSSVRSVRYRPQDDAVFASGGRDGQVRVWDTRCNVKGDKVSSVGVIKMAHCVSQQNSSKRKKTRLGPGVSQDCQQSVTCVLFQDDNLLTTSGAVDGCVKVWDIRRIKPDSNSAVYNFPYMGTSKRTHGFSSLTFDTYFTKLFANCTDDVIYCYDFISYKPEPVCTYRGHRNTSFYVKSVLSPDNEFLLSGSADEQAYIWQVSKPNASPVVLKGHRSEISDVAWCKTDLFRIVTTSDDNTVRVWRYDATAEIRKKRGRPDFSCGIVGSAERTHRDIGTSVESEPKTPKRSPYSAMKRSASSPFGPVTAVTPKQAKTSESSAPSPSIKMWLKRSASAPNSGTLVTGDQACEVGEPDGIKDSRLDKPEVVTFSSAKKQKIEIKGTPVTEPTSEVTEKLEVKGAKQEIVENIGGQKESVRKSCKRKLVEENSPKKSKKQRLGSDLEIDHCNVIDEDKENSRSPVKRKSNTENSKFDLSKSPGKKRGESVEVFQSPARTSLKEQGESVEVFQSPARTSLKEQDRNIYRSPTANLPNLVIDGPQRKTQHPDDDDTIRKSVDWLTEMRIRKLSKQSPRGNKKCRSKLLDKLSDSSGSESSQATERSAKCRIGEESLVPGIRSIASFFAPTTLKS